jgi:hypothetical protein
LDGFSFCVSNQDNEIYFLKDFSFPETVTIDTCLEEIVTVFKHEKELQFDFKNVFVIHQNYLNTIVPNALFDENELASYLKFTVKTLATDVLEQQYLYDN